MIGSGGNHQQRNAPLQMARVAAQTAPMPQQRGGSPTLPESAGTSFAPPVLSLPKGGGAIRGMGEKFAANPVMGTGSMTVPIAASPGRGGFGPQLSISYDSGKASISLRAAARSRFRPR